MLETSFENLSNLSKRYGMLAVRILYVLVLIVKNIIKEQNDTDCT